MKTPFKPVEKMMNERIRVPGFPQVIVTREFLLTWLGKLGWSACERGFGSRDYMVFGRPATSESLTDKVERDALLGQVADSYRRESAVAAGVK